MNESDCMGLLVTACGAWHAWQVWSLHIEVG